MHARYRREAGRLQRVRLRAQTSFTAACDTVSLLKVELFAEA
jgi:hypothetical protein